MNRGMEEGIRLFKARRFEHALREFLTVEDNPAENLDLSYYLGLCYTKLKFYEEALLYLEQVVTSHTNLFRIYQGRMILSYIYTVTERFKLAQFELDSLVEAGFASPQVYAAYGYIAYAQNQVEKSIEYLKKALELDPENPNALNSLGYIMAEEEIDLQEALKYCREAVRLRPENPSYLDSLGWTYYRLGKYDEALISLKKAHGNAAGHRVIGSHLREVMQKLPKP